MGNGASVVEYEYRPPPVSSDTSNFHLLERKCSSGYFLKNQNDYYTAVSNAIKRSDIAQLEILIPAGDIRTILPLHIAAKQSALDSIELLLSAGINPTIMDEKGRTPLHYCALASSKSSALCCSFLLSVGNKLLKIRDREGNTALHLATKANNIHVVKCLMEHGSSATLSNNSGQSSISIAMSNGYTELIDYFDSLQSNTKKTNSQTNRKKKSPQDMERIMQVWEKFFENAFKNFEAELEAENQYDPAFVVDSRNMKAIKANASAYDDDMKLESYHSISSSKSKKSIYIQSSMSNITSDGDSESVVTGIWQWMSWFITYDENKIGEDYAPIGYFIANLYNTNESYRDMDNHLYDQEQYSLWLRFPGDDEFCSVYPSTLGDVVRNGWMIYYDKDENLNKWMHIPTGTIENCLPVGYDVNANMCGLTVNPSDPTWAYPPTGASHAWMMIECIREPSNDQNKDISDTPSNSKWDDEWNAAEGSNNVLWYYSNRMTGHSSWTEPSGWSQQVEEANGWVLCSNELMQDMYWWNMYTGEVSWCDDNDS
jgi:hypothetical protein